MALQINYNYNIKYYNNRAISDTDFTENFPKAEKEILKTVLCENTYVMINNINGGKENLDLYVSIFKDSSKNVLIENKTYKFIPDVNNNSENFIKQGYKYLKLLDEYRDAVDLLDDGQII